ncbi:50S ribosomal protein L11 [Candidatus Bathyarchaeota archaeon RBG_16_57_9]|nr:MAG: 50S ribosomal protein L11 [Candidatus Bathyarchaeota archaeon RBG_16_57_9]OGD53767.1 MAG: 50S ribosomal protein L11 [Candidatus Bathyarchaeota archaeon RBG_13_60_20]
MVDKSFNFIVNGGKATGGPPIGPALGPMGVNIMAIVNEINAQTKEYDGLPVPVDVVIDTDTKKFTVKVGMLTTFALISQAAGLEKGSGTPNTAYVADITMDKLIGIAKKKRPGLYAASLKTAVREVLGTCQSAGVTVEGRPAKEVQQAIKAGEFDEKLAEV